MATKTTEQAFADMYMLVGKINRVKSDIQEAAREIGRIEELAKEILDDPVRKANLKKLIDIHPTHTVSVIEAEIAKLKTLKEKLV